MSNFDQTLEEPDLQMWLKSSLLPAVCAKAHKADLGVYVWNKKNLYFI